MIEIVTLDSKFRISIPKKLCSNQGWRAGQKLAFLPKGRGVMLMPVPTLDDLHGIAKGADTSNYRDREDRY